MKPALWRVPSPNEARVGGVSTNLTKNRLLESKCEACVLKHGFFVFVLFLQSCGVRLRLFGTGPRRAVVWPDAPVRPVGTVAVPTLRYDPSGRSPSRRSGTTRRDGSRPDAPVRPVGTFAVPTPRWVTSSRRLTTLQIKPVRLASQPLSVAYVPRAVSALRDSGRSGAAAAAVVQDGRILGIAHVFRLE